jgi:hypothetical protein
MHTALRLAAVGLAVAALGTATPDAQARPAGWGGHGGVVRVGGGYHGGYHGGYYRGGYGGWWGPGVVLGGVALGLGIAALGSYDYYYPPSYVTMAPPPVVVTPAPAAVAPAAAATAAPSMVEPVIYPRNGQSAAQTEADRQDCQRWATTQPRALSDGSVFQRGVFACMDARGYTLR